MKTNIYQVELDKANATVRYEENWIEINVTKNSGDWRRFFYKRTPGDTTKAYRTALTQVTLLRFWEKGA